MPNLWGASPVGRDDIGRSGAAWTIGGRKQSRRVKIEVGFPARIGWLATTGHADR